MSDADLAGAEAGPIDVVPVTGDNAVMSARDAARTLASFRYKKQNPETSQASEAPEPAAPEPAHESADEADAAPLETEATGETQATDRAQEPPLELPRSWTKDRAEHWAKLDRGTQEFLLDHDSKASAEVRRVQNEAAEQRKVIETERQKVEQARQLYETARERFISNSTGEIARAEQDMMARYPELANIRTEADFGAFRTQLAAQDWPRSQMFEVAVAERSRLINAKADAERQQSQDRQQRLGTFENEQAKLFAEKVPEYFDPKKKAELQNQAIALLKDHLGFSDQELGEIYNADKGLSLRDHRTQLLLLDGIRYREAKSSAARPALKPVPPVQRPGVSQPRGAGAAADVQNLSQRLDKTGSLKDAARFIAARRAAR